MISLFLSSSLTSGSVLTAQSLEPALDSVSPSLFAPPCPPLSLSAPPQLALCVFLSLKNKEKHLKKCFKKIKIEKLRGTWVVQLVKRPTLVQVMISWFMGSSPVLGSVLTAESLEPASDSVPLSQK